MEIASYNLVNEILKALSNKSKVGGISFDLEKAFDCVNQKILLSKLQFCGITDNMYNLIRSYFENRYQRVSLSHKLTQSNISNWVPSNIRCTARISTCTLAFFTLY